MDRRTFLASGTAATFTALRGVPSLLAEQPTSAELRIIEPFDGAVLNRRHGQVLEQGLKIHVSGEGPAGEIRVNGIAAERDGKSFSAEIVLDQHDNEIVAEAPALGQKHRIRVCWDRHSFPRYRFAIDDNSFFLRDIYQKNAKSIFDCFYLAGLRDLHRKYGTKFALNIYYTTGDDFSLPQFPDRYKSEWQDNAEWLRLSFHAWADKPDRPYENAPAEKVLADLDRVAEQILRFAGETVYAPTTIIHFGLVRPEAFKPLASRGIRVLSGYFTRSPRGFEVNYRLDETRSEYLSRHDAWKDYDSGITFSKIDIVCNTVPLEKIPQVLQAAVDDPNQAEVMDLMTHEQYFWPFYQHYIPEHFQRLDAAIGFVTERGYKPVFLHEGCLGAPV